jgi:hypothetical protein
MSVLTDELERAKRRTTKQNNMSTFKLLVKEQRVNEMERQVQAINVDVVSYNPQNAELISEEEVYDRLIELNPNFMHEFIMTRLCPRQRAELFERVSVLDAYELNEMNEREYMAEYKFQLYNQYLSQQ